VGVDFLHKREKRLLGTPYSYDVKVRCGPNGSAPRVEGESLRRRLSRPPLVFDSHPPSDAPEQTDSRHLAVRLAKGGNWRKTGPKLVGLANQPILTQALDLAARQDADGRVRAAVEAALEELESIRFIDFSPEMMRKPSIPGQLILSDRGDNLSSVLQAICDRPELKRALSQWIGELTPMDVVDFEFQPDAAGRVLVYLVEQNGKRTSANSASDGTLRFLGMLAALLGPKPAKLYFLEEIDTGIHPARLALLMDLLENQSRSKGIRILATTHSPQVLRLIKPENLAHTTLAYRLRGSAEGKLKPLADIPHLLEVLKTQDLARLHESSWMERTMEFTEGTPRPFPLEPDENRP
jgi:hypothetical protein